MITPRISRAAFLLCWVLATAVFAEEAAFQAEVISVIDGDTLEVLHDGKPLKIRLYGIDSPEKGQSFGTKAKSQLSSLVFSKIVTVEKKDVDRYGRTVADLALTDGTNINREMVKSGYAWWFEKYAPGDQNLKTLEAEARAAKRGLWADSNPQAPWNLRQQKRSFNNDDLAETYGYKPVEPGSIKKQPSDDYKEPGGKKQEQSGKTFESNEPDKSLSRVDPFGGVAIIAPSYWTKREADEIFSLLGIQEASLQNSRGILVVIRSRFVGRMNPEYSTPSSVEGAAKSFDSFLESSDPSFHLYLYTVDSESCKLWGYAAYSIGNSLSLGNFTRYQWE